MTRYCFLLLLAVPVAAHVGSPDVFFDGMAGPHKVYVAVRTPQVIPGVAEIEVRVPNGGVDRVRITPTPLTGPGARFAPTADVTIRSPQDPNFFTGTLWMMSSGAWQVRINVEGSAGSGELRVPVPALARRTAVMEGTLGIVLFVLMVFLAIGAVSIAGAAAREGKLPPGVTPPPENRRRAWITMGIAAVMVVWAIVLGNFWWKAEASGYSRIIFKPLAMKASVNNNQLTLQLEHTGWLQAQDFADLIPDHGHLMHLFVLRLPELDRMWHLHPRMTGNGVFVHDLPSMPVGKYQFFADIVHRNGLAETMVASLDIPAIDGVPLQGDDSAEATELVATRESVLAGNYRMRFLTEDSIRARQLTVLKFRVEDELGRPATDLEPYLGMPAHAAVVKKDLAVFAHLHPSGTVPMATLAMAQEQKADPHAGHSMVAASLPAEVTFPYGFPEPGAYRLFVQVKRAGKVETGVFDVNVGQP